MKIHIEVDSIDGSYVRLRSKAVEDFSIVREIEDGISVIGGSREGDYVYSDISIYEAKEGFEIYSVVFKDEREVKLKISEWRSCESSFFYFYEEKKGRTFKGKKVRR